MLQPTATSHVVARAPLGSACARTSLNGRRSGLSSRTNAAVRPLETSAFMGDRTGRSFAGKALQHGSLPSFEADRKKFSLGAVLGGTISQGSSIPVGSGTVSIPLNPRKLLGVKDDATPSDAVLAHERLVEMALEDGYSDAVLLTRKKLLDDALAAMVDEEKAPIGDAMTSIRWERLPGALALLQEAGETQVVLEYGDMALKSRSNPPGFDRDVLLAMALAQCDLGREALTSEEVAVGCSRLNEALRLLQDAGQRPPLAPNLALEIDASLEALVPPCVLEHLALPDTPECHECRQGALKVLHAMMARGSTGRTSDDLSPSYVRAALRRLSAEEVLAVADWGEVAERGDEFPWHWKGGLVSAALAHVATGVNTRRPQLIEEADRLLSAAAHQGAAADVERSACALLLGDVEGSLARLGWGDASLLDPMAEVREAMSGERGSSASLEADLAVRGPGAGKGLVMATSSSRMSPRQVQREALRFIRDASGLAGREALRREKAGEVSPEELLPGLCLFTEKWLVEVAFARFRDTSKASPSLVDYFNDKRVTRHLAALAEGGGAGGEEGAGGALGGAGRAWGRLVWGAVGSIGGVFGGAGAGEGAGAGARAALAPSSSPAPSAPAARAGPQLPNPGSAAGAAGAAAAMGPGTTTSAEALSAGTVPVPVPSGGDELPPLIMRGVEESSSPQPRVRPPGGRRGKASVFKPRSWPRPVRQATALALLAGAVAGTAVVRGELIQRAATQRAASGGRAAATGSVRAGAGKGAAKKGAAKKGAAGSPLAGVAGRLQKASAAAGAAAGGTIAAVKEWRPFPARDASSSAAAAPTPSSSSTPDVRSTPDRPICSRAEAEKLIRKWQASKAMALGEKRAVSGLRDVLTEPMLSQWRDRVSVAEKSGFHWNYRLSSLVVDKLEPAKVPAGGGKWAPIMNCEVLLGEFAELVGADGRRLDSYSTTYRAKYELKPDGIGGWLLSKGSILK